MMNTQTAAAISYFTTIGLILTAWPAIALSRLLYVNGTGTQPIEFMSKIMPGVIARADEPVYICIAIIAIGMSHLAFSDQKWRLLGTFFLIASFALIQSLFIIDPLRFVSGSVCTDCPSLDPSTADMSASSSVFAVLFIVVGWMIGVGLPISGIACGVHVAVIKLEEACRS